MTQAVDNQHTSGHAAAFRLVGAGVAVRLVGTVVTALAGTITIALAVRLLGTSTYGLLAFAVTVMSLVAGLGRLGLEAGVTRSIASLAPTYDQTRLRTLARGSFGLTTGTGAVGFVAVLVTLMVASLADTWSTDLGLGLAFGFVVFGVNAAAVGASFARGVGRMATMEVATLVQIVGRLVVLVALALAGAATLGAVAAGYALVAGISIAVAVTIVRRLVGDGEAPTPRALAAKEVLIICLPFAATNLALVVVSRFDAIVLGFSGSSTDVGLYEPTLKLVEQVMLLSPLLFLAPYLPAATRLAADAAWPSFRELYIGVSKLGYVVAVPAIVLFSAFPEATLHSLYGDDFPVDDTVVWILLVGFVVNLVFGVNGSALAAIGNRRALTRVGLLGTGAMIVFALALVPVFGPRGAALATASTYVVMNVSIAFALLRSRGVHPFARDFSATLGLSVLPILGGLAVREWTAPENLWTAAGWSLAVSAVWVAALFGLRLLRPHELKRLLPASRSR